MKKIILFIFSLFFTIGLVAKEDVSGCIKDTSGKPLKGIRMRINGLFKTTKSKGNGMFKMKNIIEGDSLIVYVTEKRMAIFPVKPNMTMELELGSESLLCKTKDKEVHYYYQDVPNVTYSNNIITARQIKETSARNLVELLRGRVPGLEIQDANGTPKAQIRGAMTMNLNTEPLFIVGNSQYDSLDAANGVVSLEDIKEIEVKKDGSEYGIKGANGVILIRMK